MNTNPPPKPPNQIVGKKKYGTKINIVGNTYGVVTSTDKNGKKKRKIVPTAKNPMQKPK